MRRPRTSPATLAVLTILLVVSSACASTTTVDTTTPTVVEQPTTTAAPPTTVAALADGEYFSWVTVGTDESGAMTLGVDLAEMLTGEDARQAAIDAGVIGEGEDLPNDMYISNPDSVLELLHVADDASFEMISVTDPGSTVTIDATQLGALVDGSYDGVPIYGVVEGQPIAMTVTVAGGLVTGATAVYLP